MKDYMPAIIHIDRTMSKNDASLEQYITVIPDVHGRAFWHSAVSSNPDRKTVFLGDYLDPYSFEGITPEMALDEFRQILDWKKLHPDNVTLLLGNHDLGYLDIDVCTCRHDWQNAVEIGRLLNDNLEQFDIVHTDGGLLFSHAGVGKDWLEYNLGKQNGALTDPSFLNLLFHDDGARGMLMQMLSQVSCYRGGDCQYGSCVWADKEEFHGGIGLLEGYYHVFGHTQSPVPVPTGNNGICLDCHSPFTLGPGVIGECV